MKIDKINILGVNLDNIGTEEALRKIEDFCNLEKQHYSVTPNPEILLAAQKDIVFKNILNNADLKIIDGAGLVWAAYVCKNLSKVKILNIFIILFRTLKFIFYKLFKFKFLTFANRITGVDFMKEICKRIPRKVFLLGAIDGVAEEAIKKMQNLNYKCEFVGCFSGDVSYQTFPLIKKKIEISKAEILFVAFGAPKQELWIAEHLHELKNIKVAMGVGGSFDYIAGVVKRAPNWMRKFGLEWLYRLVKQPWRIRRIFNAVVRFPWVVIRN